MWGWHGWQTYITAMLSEASMFGLQWHISHLIESMIFTDKSLTHVYVAYLQYLGNLNAFHEYTWEVVASAYLYDHLSYANQNTK